MGDISADQRALLEVATVARAVQAATSDYTTLPARFLVPGEAPWPVAYHHHVLQVGKVRKQFKNGTLPPAVVAELDALRFVWDLKEHSWTLRLRALEAYKAHHGHVLVPYEFIVPADDAWPLDARGSKLGVAVTNIRSRVEQLPPARKAALDALGFVWDSQELVFQTKLVALAAFAAEHGHAHVPFEFRVPLASPRWPQAAWGLKLGRAVHDLRCRADALPARRRAQLDALGFVWDSHEHNWATKLLAMRCFKRQTGNLLVPQDFVVPATAPWPEPTWRLRLGQAITNIRFRAASLAADRRRQLAQIGFVWDYPELRDEAKVLLDFTLQSALEHGRRCYCFASTGRYQCETCLLPNG
ncbi:hypothetical protein ACHHYP_01652 [Achlya hypogyna]|uniref:Helicase-associated domain-containing protein n=1 Tax=Achlya hypogyna TaxID=1202772 RepID=A0A1V9Z848_ACHHY|nr:hypothetical protein ACHHYP_01652 [Achlya hypogyna]